MSRAMTTALSGEMGILTREKLEGRNQRDIAQPDQVKTVLHDPAPTNALPYLLRHIEQRFIQGLCGR